MRLAEKKFRYFVEKNGCKILGEVKNEHGEPYVVYQLPYVKHSFFVTGSEVDWELGWLYEVASGRLIQHLALDLEEEKAIRDVINRATSDMWPEKK